ncbi:MAG: hypothetical protein Q9220_005375 [cf. Caloplaca sp. 1 TL-2023]
MSVSFTKPKKQLTWLITGCSSGFGLSLARFALASGNRVIATSRNPSKAPELVKEIENKGGRWIQLDVDDPKSGQVVDDLGKSGHEIDVLVNNAGYCLFAPVETSTEDEVRAQMETMYFGPLRLIRAVLPYMRKRRFGMVVNMSSGAALDGRDSMGPYAGAKGGLDAVTKVLAKEVAPFNIRALTVVLGLFDTNFGNAGLFSKDPLPDDYKGSVADQMNQAISSGKMTSVGDPDKAMKAVYEVVVGDGAGAGRGAERLLPLGSDMVVRVKGLSESLIHSLEVFGKVTDNVSISK